MKRIIASSGMVALGALCGVSAQAQQAKPWSVSASLRGFYDDNYATLPKVPAPGTPAKQSSLGFEVSPSVKYDLNLEEVTTISLGYKYGLKYYADRANNKIDQSHEATVVADHRLSESYKVSLNESFAISQEPGVLDKTLVTTPLRSEGNNIRNTIVASIAGELTREVGWDITYSNTMYDYQSTGPASRSALLDRIENLLSLSGRWRADEELTAVVGYQLGLTEQTSHDSLTIPPAAFVSPSTRDSLSHYGFVGADYIVSKDINVSCRFGIQYTDYPQALPGVKRSSLNPYVDVSGNYQFAKDSTWQLGVKHQRNQTDVVGGTLDAESTSVYTSVTYALTAKISASGLAQYQSSTFNQGANNGAADNLFLAGLNVAYKINEFLSAEAGYNFDRLDSDIGFRSYSRNRIYIGVRATY